MNQIKSLPKQKVGADKVNLVKPDMNKPKNLIKLMQLFGIPLNSMTYAQTLEEISVIYVKPAVLEVEKDFHDKVEEMKLAIENLREQIKDLQEEPNEVDYIDKRRLEEEK